MGKDILYTRFTNYLDEIIQDLEHAREVDETISNTVSVFAQFDRPDLFGLSAGVQH